MKLAEREAEDSARQKKTRLLKKWSSRRERCFRLSSSPGLWAAIFACLSRDKIRYANGTISPGDLTDLVRLKNIGVGQLLQGWENYRIERDDLQGEFTIGPDGQKSIAQVRLGASTGPGDQTVPLRSSDQQRKSGSFAGIFVQVGYEHQDSYKNEIVLESTLFSLVRIIQKMKWSKDG